MNININIYTKINNHAKKCIKKRDLITLLLSQKSYMKDRKKNKIKNYDNNHQMIKDIIVQIKKVTQFHYPY